jgi:hypothetical protein
MRYMRHKCYTCSKNALCVFQVLQKCSECYLPAAQIHHDLSCLQLGELGGIAASKHLGLRGITQAPYGYIGVAAMLQNCSCGFAVYL